MPIASSVSTDALSWCACSPALVLTPVADGSGGGPKISYGCGRRPWLDRLFGQFREVNESDRERKRSKRETAESCFIPAQGREPASDRKRINREADSAHEQLASCGEPTRHATKYSTVPVTETN